MEQIWELLRNFDIEWPHIVAAYLLVAVVTVVLGLKRYVVVYHDYTDVALCVALIYLPISISFMSMFLQGMGLYTVVHGEFALTPVGWVVAGTFLAIAGWVLIGTWNDNRSIWRTLLAYPTKLLLGIIWGLSVLESIAPSGKSMAARARNRQGALATLFITTPIMIQLVRHQKGLMSPRAIIPARQRGIVQSAEESAARRPWKLPHEANRTTLENTQNIMERSE